MSNILSSKAFHEFIQKRCEEIKAEDKTCCRINSKILQLEKELLPMLSDEAKVKFLKIDELTLELIDHICAIIPTINLR